jgi:hypothetical protein
MTSMEPRDLVEYQSDHDVLIELRTEMRGMRADIKSLNDDTKSRQDKADIRIGKLEDDVSSLKTARAIAYAYAGLITLVLIPIAAAYISSGRI